MFCKCPSPQPGPAGTPANAGPRWPLAAQSRVHGFATFEWDIVEGTVWYSEEWRAMVQDGYDNAAVNNEAWWAERVVPGDMDRLYRASLAMHAGLVEESEILFRLRRGDGVIRTFLARSKITAWTRDGAPALASGFCADVTDIAVSEQKFGGYKVVSEEDYQSMLENSPDLFVRFDRDLRPVYVNPAVNRYLGGMNNTPGTAKRLTGSYAEVFRENVTKVFDDHVVVRKELRFSMSDGSEIVGDCTFWPEHDAAGNVCFAMAQFKDVTEQRRMEQQLKLNERRFKATYRLTMMESASESDVLRFVMENILRLAKSRSGFIFLPRKQGSAQGRIYWSENLYKKLGRDCLPRDRLPEDFCRRIGYGENLERCRRINNGSDPEHRLRLFDGRLIVKRAAIASAMEGRRIVCLAGVGDRDSDYEEYDLQQIEAFINSAWLILRRRRSMFELREAKEAAEAANKAKNIFLANVSHELRTPLNGVLSMLQLIDADALKCEQREYLHAAHASGATLLRIISDILDYSSMEAGKITLTEELFDCEAVVRSALGLFEENAAEKGIQLSLRVVPSVPRLLQGDKERVRQIVFNIVGNAMKFTDKGSVSVVLSPLPDAPFGEAGVVLEVADTGIGIPGNRLGDIFEAFTQVESSHSKQYAGNGIGLSIVKHLVALMGGEISVESELGTGTTVRCTLFFKLLEGRERNRREAFSRVSPERALDILVAEDDSVGRMALRAFLRRRGHRVLCVEDGGRALEALQLYPFHCLFTDIAMPGMDGLDLLRRVRENAVGDFPPSAEMIRHIREEFGEERGPDARTNPALPVVAVSAHSMLGDKERFLARGMDYYISKPLNGEELDGALAYVDRRCGGALSARRS
ncbi:MAG: response regulator [Deltaproteobacteria bacterium]|jgi:PAS domain S-box-containing protein|nr:response regulator [Deltaproteobacteria bacterium]